MQPFSCDQLISHLLASDVESALLERALSISIRYPDGQIPLLLHTTQQVLSEIPRDTFMITQLRSDV